MDRELWDEYSGDSNVSYEQGYHTYVEFDEPQERVEFMKRLDRHVRRVGPDYCWVWTGELSPKGFHGIFRDGDFAYLAHRAAYQLDNGSLRRVTGAVVRHKCDYSRCVNPDHLEIGTQLQNVYDAISRRQHGLTIAQILRVRKNQSTTRIVSEVTGVARSTVSKIKNKKAFNFIGPDGGYVGPTLDPRAVARMHCPPPRYSYAVREGILPKAR